MKNLFAFLSLSFLVLLASCDNKEVESKYSFSSDMLNSITGHTSSDLFSGSYLFDIDNVAGTMNITAKEVRFNAMMPAVTFVMKDVPFSLDNNGYSINASNIVPEVGGQKLENYTIEKLSGKILPSYKSDQLTISDVTSLSYSLTSGFVINALPQTMYFPFNSSTVVNMGESSFSNTKSIYALKVNQSDNTASLIINGAQFAEKMPSLNMVFPNIALSASKDGLLLKSESLTPQLRGNDGSLTPFPAYTISNLKGEVANNVLKVSFTCTITAQGSTMAGAFNVNAEAAMFQSAIK